MCSIFKWFYLEHKFPVLALEYPLSYTYYSIVFTAPITTDSTN